MRSTLSAVPAPPSSVWWRYHRPTPDPALRLICFAHGGGGASAFRDWSGLAPDGVEVVPVALPGRESRLGDPLPETFGDLARDTSEALLPLFDVPFALLGVSFGSVLAFEVAHRLRSVHGFGPSALAVCAEWAPTWSGRSDDAPNPALGTEEEFLADVRAGQVLPDSVLDDPDLLAVALPALRGDAVLSASYRYRDREPLDCPVVAFRGRHDPRVGEGDMRPWSRETTAGFAYHEVDSGHLVLDAAGEVLATLTGHLREEGLL